ncbi:MAG TPA: hypothetical protein VK468_04140, partial [Pyrinomonadaceae bacterium]|nr:hypothetical protein [Pyrinomonadaceae bacterium]
MKLAKIVSLFALTAALAASLYAQNSAGPFVKDEVLVKFAAGTGDSARSAVVAKSGANIVESLGDQGWVRVRLNGGEDVRSAVVRLQQLRNVETVQPNFYYHLLLTPNDPQFTSSGMYGLTKISAPQAWDL